MRVLLTALALMAFAFVLNLMGDLSVASSSTGPMLRGTTSARVAIEPAPIAAPPVVRNVARAKEIPPAAPMRVAVVEKPAKVALMKSTAIARATPEAAKFAAGPAKTVTAKATGLVNFDRA
jgi:hypothetical protein